MSNIVNTNKLETLISLFDTHSDKKNDDSEIITNKLLNVMIVGMNQLNAIQVEKLERFSERISKGKADERLVLIVRSILINRLSEIHLARELYVLTHTFRVATTMKQYLPEDKADFILHVASIMNHASTGKHPINFVELTHYTKVFLACLDDHSTINFDKNRFLLSIKTVLMNIQEDEVNASVVDFHESACVLIKKLEAGFTPQEILEHPAFHGDALNSAINKLEEIYLKKMFKANTVVSFAIEYCEEKIGFNQYMIRHSSRAFTKGENFFFTISYRASNGKLFHRRAVKSVNHQGKVEWRWSTTKNILGKVIFDSLQMLIDSHREIKRCSPVLGPNESEVFEILNRSFYGTE